VKLMDEPALPPPPEIKLLTARENEVLKLVAQGMNNREIAAELFITEPTVKTHISNIMHKLNLRDRVEIALFAFQYQLAPAPLPKK